MDKKIKYGEEGIYISSSESGFCSDEDPDPMIFGLPIRIRYLFHRIYYIIKRLKEIKLTSLLWLFSWHTF